MGKEVYLFFSFIILLNIVSFILFQWDKRLLRHHRSGISAQILMTIAFLGGALGELLAMLVFHHKWHHWGYVITLPILVLVQLIALWIFLKNYLSTTVDPVELQNFIPA